MINLDYFDSVSFAQPLWLLLLLLLPVLTAFHIWRYRKRYAALRIPGFQGLSLAQPGWRVRLLPLLTVLRMLAIGAIVIALARPQSSYNEEKVESEGIDIMIAMDVSSSMLAIDFEPNRMEAAKETAIEFIEGRPYDGMGVVVFAGESFTQCPLTLDHELLKSQVKDADSWQLDDGTALGDGCWMAINRLMDTSSLSSRVVILLTDGVQTAGDFAPIDAAKAAADNNIRIYTVGIGSNTDRPIPVYDRKQRRKIYDLDPKISFDEETLEKIAKLTGGKYYRATSKSKLREIYREIDQLEKQKIELNVSTRFEEKFFPFAWAAAIFLLLEVLLRNTLLRTTT